MITLKSKLKRDGAAASASATNSTSEGGGGGGSSNPSVARKRVSIRDRLLVAEVQELEQNMPATCKVHFPDPNVLSEFTLAIQPDEGFWLGGRFKFVVSVPEEYNMTPPRVKCTTKLWHPNISVTGDVCLSLLRQHSIDGLGWAPTRRLKDVVWGLDLLFTNLLNFDDPLNSEAADQYLSDKTEFHKKVREYIAQNKRSK